MIRSSKNDIKQCCVCYEKSNNPKVDMPMMIFDAVENSPAICEKCLFEKLTGTKRDWDKKWISPKTGKYFWEE